MSRMTDTYTSAYWETGEGSNYHSYGDDLGWKPLVATINHFLWLDGLGPWNVAIREVACSKGYFVKTAREWGYDAEGMDISAHAINSAPAAVKPYLRLGNAGEALPWPDESADVVCSWEFFEHVYEDEIDRVLAEKLRVLKAGGHLWMKIGIVTPVPQPDQDHSHYTVQPREWWEAKFAGAGLEHRAEIEAHLDQVFPDRDWMGRFFVWRKP